MSPNVSKKIEDIFLQIENNLLKILIVKTIYKLTYIHKLILNKIKKSYKIVYGDPNYLYKIWKVWMRFINKIV